MEMSQELLKAREYEEQAEKKISAKERPGFHLSVRTGWMNDPNGFSFYDGVYHLFYQYQPYETNWGPMHWGHAVSKDFLHWEYLPAALAPDAAYDKDGCFSGSAAVLPDGRQLLLYTGVSKEAGADGKEKEIQRQCAAVGNGTDYEKYEKNPVIDGNMLPVGASKIDFRDPKIWREEDDRYFCVAGNRAEDGSGQILLFESGNGFDWNFKSVLCENKGRFGSMWECPDFFKLEDKWVLITSPQDMLTDGREYPNGNGTLALVGAFDKASGKFLEETNQTLDFGIDFYAPQTTLTPDGRRVMIGWMQNWDTCGIRKENTKWFGQMTLARELFMKNGRVCQRPVKELEILRGEKTEYRNVVFEGEKRLDGVKGRRVELELCIRPEKEMYHKFMIHFAENESFHTSLGFFPMDSRLEFDRSFSGTRRAGLHKKDCRVFENEGELRLHIILDHYSAEVFINDGEQVMTAAFYTELAVDGISFAADGEVCMDVVHYQLG